jgi:hypothetical protein
MSRNNITVIYGTERKLEKNSVIGEGEETGTVRRGGIGSLGESFLRAQ